MNNLQDEYIKHLIKTEQFLTVFLTNGVKLTGSIVESDKFTVLIRKDNHTQLAYKSAIATIMPEAKVPLAEIKPNIGNEA